MKKNDLPEGANIFKSKWVFKKKKNGMYHIRLVAKAYNQIPGIDFTKNFAPMRNDVTSCTIMILLLFNLE